MNKPFQRVDSTSNAHAGIAFELAVQAYFASQDIHLTLKHPIDVGVSKIKKKHNFDLGSENPKVLVECKSHRWTIGDSIPSAKLTVWNEAMLYFLSAPSDYRKILCVLEHHSERRGSLASYYLRIYRHLIPDDVEIWEFNEGNGQAQKIHPI